MSRKPLLTWLCIIAGLILSAIWLLAATVSGFSVPHWVPPAGLFAVALGVALTLL